MTAPQPTSEDAPPQRSYLAIGLVAVLALALVGGALVLALALGGGDQGETYSFVIPAGTSARQDAGEEIIIMPDKLEIQVGDTLRIENQDVRVMTIGPFTVRPGEKFSHRFGQAGSYKGYCSVGEGKVIEILVT